MTRRALTIAPLAVAAGTEARARGHLHELSSVHDEHRQRDAAAAAGVSCWTVKEP